ncbi:septal ring lytic transglycosylase RlpA family protein [Aminobacter sp. J44]|uniref:septal ring lytic transglycosylase RlpA family protein n=1 Tax=Aminobacter sp. J44 TaxID=935262 RepID=UPI00119BC968|nr:rare lipoprotein A [Aminobacter sp. J44]
MAVYPSRAACKRLGALLGVVSAITLASCAAKVAEAPKKPKRSKEYFAESVYGVKASPRVTNLASNLPRGGGRDQVGKPYQVKGKWYHPKEDPNYKKSGLASWYGDAFHGRLTANGEIYDMTHLTAAHPTMPLPSYARVTNKENGNSVIVRVNDRGPYEHNRLIDVSRRAAEMLGYAHRGVARVEVEYLGRAPLHGKDDEFLMASFRPGNGKKPMDPSDGLPTGVMIAMNGPTPTQRPVMASTSPFGSFGGHSPAPAPIAAQAAQVASVDVVLPEFGPIVPWRPDVRVAAAPAKPLAYAGHHSEQQPADDALARLAGDPAAMAKVVEALNQRYSTALR